MVLLLLLAALLQEPVSSSLHGSRFLAGALGGSITHQCFYSSSPANRHQRKYWCRVAASGACYTIVSSSFTSSQYRGRVALGDTPQNGSFRVTLTGLSSSDSGTYRCGIGSTNQGLHVSLNLTVLPDAPVSRPAQLIPGELHGSVTVLCPSGDTQGGQERFWCKVGRSSCTLVASSGGFVGRRYQGRVVISPQDSSGAFRVLMNDLKKEDSGLYVCGTQGPRGQESPQEVVLQVATASILPRRPKFLSGTVGGSVTFQCHHDPRGTYEQQYLCRWEAGSCPLLLDLQGFVLESYQGRIQMSSSGPGSSTVLLRQLREEDEGWYWCGARSGDSELTAPLMLLIHKETFSSRDPGTSPPVRPTALNPAAHSTAWHRSVAGMGTVPKGTSMGTVPKSYTMGSVTQDTTMGTVPTGTSMGSVTQDTTMGSVPKGSSMGSVPKGSSMGTATQDSSSPLPTATPGTSAASPGETFQESSSGEPGLLPAVLPALLLLICVTITILTLAKIKLQKQTGEERSTMGSLDPAQAGLSPGREGRMEEKPGEEQEFRMGSGKCRTISAILGNIRMISFYRKIPFPGA
ncbi:polymeric immunoglobulin receptor-like isoform X2 [Oenanthe melanoleuca]|uniref:polymeric immunoglobulin receptor-like isoform X2 n=1 Tax=Oenanthe melanoleuca TaxID=2939378 RepID=UPI0024C19E0F|nr:polymeric immunoglobulin receptor-like isoform X2 [Oenanthe melanoleuca]